MNYTLFFCVVLCCFSGTITPLSPEIPFDTICDDPWRTAEFIFITTPEKELNSHFKQAVHLGLYAAGTIPGIMWLEKNNTIERLKEYIHSDEFYPEKKLVIDGIVSFFLSILPAEILSHFIKYIARKKIHFKHFKNFILIWPSLREELPKTFHKIFDYIHEAYSKSQSDRHLKKMAAVTIPKVHEAIHEQFPVKYYNQTALTSSVLSFIKRSLITFGLASLAALLISEEDIKIPNKIPQNITLPEIFKKPVIPDTSEGDPVPPQAPQQQPPQESPDEDQGEPDPNPVPEDIADEFDNLLNQLKED